MLRDRRVRAEGGLRFIEPRFIRWVYTFMRLGSPTYTRFAEGIDRVQTEGIEHLLRAFRLFYRKEARVLLAFRHAAVHDAPVMVYLLCRSLPREARRRREPLGGPGHAHFLYGRGVLHWAGGGASFLIPRIAGIPVMNRRTDIRGIRTIRRFLTEGRFPVALAPEGQVTYHNHRLGPVESGTARLALWCLEDLNRQERKEDVLIVPIATRYRFTRDPQKTFERVVEMIRRNAGLEQGAEAASRYEALLELTARLIERAEAFYSRFYPGHLPPHSPSAGRRDPASLRARIERICEAALGVPESFMGIRPEKDFLSRVFTVRQRGWDYLFRSDLPDADRPAPLDRVLADRVADETYLHLRHNELVDLLEYLDPGYIDPESSLNRLLEYALNLADMVNRLMGGDISHRYSPAHKHVQVKIDEPLNVGQLLPVIPGSRRQRVEGLTRVLVSRLRSLAQEP